MALPDCVPGQPSACGNPPPSRPSGGLADAGPDDRRLGIGPARLGVEAALEAARRADEDVARRTAAAVGERVVAARRRECQRAGAAGHELVADLEGQLAVEDVERLGEGVHVQRRAGPAGGHRDLDDADAVLALLGAQQHGGLKVHGYASSIHSVTISAAGWMLVISSVRSPVFVKPCVAPAGTTTTWPPRAAISAPSTTNVASPSCSVNTSA